MFGHSGRILRVDLTSGCVEAQSYDEAFGRRFLGGNGFAAAFIHDAVPPEADPLGQANMIVFAVGPLTGTPVWGSSRGHVAGISPLTGLFADSDFGGDFAAAQKRTGFDAICVTGQSDRPVYLLVTEDGGQLKDAADLWGQDTIDVHEALSATAGAESICIGPAGENHVLFANLVGSGARKGAAGRGGLGAVMGAKRLKAVAARGTRGTPVARPDDLKRLMADCREELRKKAALLADVGTPFLVNFVNDRGLLCTHNAARETFESSDAIDGKLIKETYAPRNRACRGCPVACGKSGVVPKGEYADETVKLPEYETLYALGSMLDNHDIVSIMNANRVCDRLGLDTISMGVTLSFVAECLERGLVDAGDLGGDVPFGNGQAVVDLTKATARREGVGDLLAQGSARLAERFGPEARKLLYSVKGLEIAGHSARGVRAMALGYATATRGGSHHDTRPQYTDPGDDPGFEGQARYSVRSQNATAVGDSLVLCRFVIERAFGALNSQGAADGVNAVTGWDLSPEDLEQVGERIYNLERLINVQRGVTRRDDTLPWRSMNEPIPDGPAKGRVCTQEQLDALLDEYYRLRGWSADGVPRPEKLRELGLPH